MSKLHFWGVGTTRTIRPIWTAEELGLDYTLTPIGSRTGAVQEPEYLKRNPKGKIPYMADGEFGLSESAAISRYLIEKYGGPDTIQAPKTAEEKAKSEEWCSFILGELDQTALYVIRRHLDLHEIYGEAPLAVKAAKEYCERNFKAAAELAVGPYLMGNSFGLPDILLMTCINWAERKDIKIHPKIKEIGAHISERPAYQRAQEINSQPAR